MIKQSLLIIILLALTACGVAQQQLTATSTKVPERPLAQLDTAKALIAAKDLTFGGEFTDSSWQPCDDPTSQSLLEKLQLRGANPTWVIKSGETCLKLTSNDNQSFVRVSEDLYIASNARQAERIAEGTRTLRLYASGSSGLTWQKNTVIEGATVWMGASSSVIETQFATATIDEAVIDVFVGGNQRYIEKDIIELVTSAVQALKTARNQ
ncbi:MAG: hypothetical protein M1546_20950 [Chloroflexi bacterium]|nr:hypothetical protein [Chloroflexota bacterium]